MSNIAVIKLAGAQHVVRAGDKFEVNRLNYEVEKDMSADVLLSTDGEKVLFKEGDVKIKVTENKLGDKLRIVKFRAKSRYRRAQGHRQPLSVVEVLSINGEKKATKAPKKEAKVEAVEVKEKKVKSEVKAKKPTTKAKKTVKSTKKGKK